jgi:hypothetical protein
MDIKSPKLLYLKGAMFVLAGLLASGILLLDHPGWKEAFLLAMAIWCFSRAYYFAFYVVEHYVDSDYRYASLWSFARYAMRRRGRRISAEEKQ